jgi:hypothetical protein
LFQQAAKRASTFLLAAAGAEIGTFRKANRAATQSCAVLNPTTQTPIRIKIRTGWIRANFRIKFFGHNFAELLAYARMSLTTWPYTSVSRKSRPSWRKDWLGKFHRHVVAVEIVKK